MSPKEFSVETIDKARARQRSICAHCGEKLSDGYPHFKKPAELGGDTSLNNCILLCQRCHMEYGHIGKWGKFVITRDYPHFSADGLLH